MQVGLLLPAAPRRAVGGNVRLVEFRAVGTAPQAVVENPANRPASSAAGVAEPLEGVPKWHSAVLAPVSGW